MKKTRNVIIAVLALIMVFALSGCSSLIQKLENQELRAHTETMINAILEDDGDAAYPLVSDFCTRNQFNSVFKEMRELLSDVDSYELELISFNQTKNYGDGESIVCIDSAYEMVTNGEKYVISVQMRSDIENLSSFYITPYEKTSLYYTGDLSSMKDASPLQWGFLLSNLIVIGIIVLAMVDCCRHKISVKPLWIVLILFGVFSVGITAAVSSFRFNFNLIWLSAYNAFIRHGDGQTVLRVGIPYGAIIYLALRWLLIKKPAAVPEQTEQNEQAEN